MAFKEADVDWCASLITDLHLCSQLNVLQIYGGLYGEYSSSPSSNVEIFLTNPKNGLISFA